MAEYDAVVVGAGPGGYVAAIRLAQLKKKVAVVERDRVGGVCLNYGCIPSKALIHAAHTFEAAGGSAQMGIDATPKLDAARLQAWKEGVVRKLTGGVAQLLKGNGAEVVAGEATVASPTLVRVKGRDGTRDLATKAVVVATGGRAVELPFARFDGEVVLSSKEALELAQIPGSVAVIGGGIIGLEITSFLARFGTHVTVIEMLEEVLPGVDTDCVRVVKKALRGHGVEFFTGAKAKSVERRGGGARVEFGTKEGEAKSIDVDRVLVSVGVRPNVEGFGLEELGVKRAERGGWVLVNERQETSVPGVFAVGDCTGPPYLAHRASKQGIVAAEVIAGEPAAADWRAMPGAIFTDPEIATVGLTAEQARAEGRDIVEGKVPFGAIGKAVAINATEGFVKLLFDKQGKQLVGAHLVGPGVSDLISELALAMEMGATADDIALTVHPHPTLPEGIMEAAEAALGRAIHFMGPPRR
ncbi:MAG TPA: dihydrolipoyl dehydrogenase [Candidatus Thermoplasmatota archaeon]